MTVLTDIVELEDGEEIVNDMIVACASVPLVPVIVNVYVPGAAFEATDIVNVDAAEPPAAGVTELGLNVAVTQGIEEEVRLTAELKPLSELTVTVDVPDVPVCTVSELGDATIVKSVEADKEHGPAADGLFRFL